MKWWQSIIRASLLLALILLVAFLWLPPLGLKNASPRTSAKNDVVQIVNAVGNYHAEYGYPPKVTENGFCETAESNARLIRILLAEDPEGNPRRVRFLEVPKARVKRGIYRSGAHPENGEWLDPWGNFYRIRIATEERRIPNPDFHDEPRFLDAGCVAWSVGKNGIQDVRNNPLTQKGSDDVLSWK